MKYKIKVVDGYEVCFASDWIYDLEKEIHFKWYYHQTKLVYENCSKEQQILEIGPGTGLLSDLLKRRGWSVRTLDIDDAKNPDFSESAADFDYQTNIVDVVLAFEIFEHIPFSTFGKVVKKIGESNVNSICFSLPWNERQLIDISLKLPKIPLIEWSWALPAGKIGTQSHFWELARKEKFFGEKKLAPISAVYKLFEENGYTVSREKKIGYIQYFIAHKS